MERRAKRRLTNLDIKLVSFLKDKNPANPESNSLVFKAHSKEENMPEFKKTVDPAEFANLQKEMDSLKKQNVILVKANEQFDKYRKDFDAFNKFIGRGPEKNQSAIGELADIKKAMDDRNADLKHMQKMYEAEKKRTDELGAKVVGLQKSFDQYELPGIPGNISPDSEKKEILKAFNVALTTKDSSHRDRQFAEIKKAMEVGVDAEGGYLVPTILSDQLVSPTAETSRLRAAGMTVLTVKGYKAFDVPKYTDADDAPSIEAEEAAAIEVDPVISEVSMVPYKHVFITKASEELAYDSKFPLLSSIIGPQAQRRVSRWENYYYTRGTGTAQPQGVTIGASASGITAAATTYYTIDEMLQIINSMNYWDSANSAIMAHQSIFSALRRETAQDGGDFLWGKNLENGQPQSFSGFRTIPNNSVLNTTGAVGCVFGNFKQGYWSVDYEPITFKFLDQLYAENDQVGYKWRFRRCGVVVDNTVLKSALLA